MDLLTDTVAILNYLDLRKTMGCPGGMGTIRYTCSVFTCSFRANFSSSFPRKNCNGKKKNHCAKLGCNNDRLFPEKYTVKFSFARKVRVNAEQVPPGHPIILLKSNKFYMAAMWAKRSIDEALSG